MSKKLSTKDVERKLNTALDHVVPDLRDKIIEDCHNSNVKYGAFTNSNSRRKYRNAVLSRVIVAAAAILMLVNLGVYGLMSSSKQVFTTIDIDVNPSIELKVNDKDRVVGVVAVNDDAIRVLDGMELEGSTTKVAVNALLGSMLSHGYLIDDTRTILISVDSKDQNKAALLKADIAQDVSTMLNAYSVEATVVSQVMTANDNNVAAMADSYGISQGKATLVQKIASTNENYTEQQLSQMSVTELDVLLDTAQVNTDIIEVSCTGDVNELIAFVEANENEAYESQDEYFDNNLESDDCINSDGDNECSSENVKNSVSEDIVSETTASENAVSENSISENTASENSVSDNTVSENAVSDNSASEDNLFEDVVFENDESEDAILENNMSDDDANRIKNKKAMKNVSENTLSENSVSKNSVSKNTASDNKNKE